MTQNTYAAFYAYAKEMTSDIGVNTKAGHYYCERRNQFLDANPPSTTTIRVGCTFLSLEDIESMSCN